MQILDTRVAPAWVDYNGHMNDAEYARVFSLAVEALMDHIGLDAAGRDRHRHHSERPVGLEPVVDQELQSDRTEQPVQPGLLGTRRVAHQPTPDDRDGDQRDRHREQEDRPEEHLAADPAHAQTRQRLAKELEDYLRSTGDSRVTGNGNVWESYIRYSPLREFPRP